MAWYVSWRRVVLFIHIVYIYGIMMEYVRCLTIAGSDSGGGAGIQADIKTMSALGVYASAVITAVTVQDTQRVHAVHVVPADIVEAQIRCVMDDIRPDAVKIGMLPDADCMKAVSTVLKPTAIKVVLDPVMVATSGDSLMQRQALDVMKDVMLPLSYILTPNLSEAEMLSGISITCFNDVDEAARRIADMGTRRVLIKGGHFSGEAMEDRYYEDGILTDRLVTPTVHTGNTHGTGCTLSSAIASFLALGDDAADAVRHAKEYISQAIAAGADIVTGHGHGPVNHLFEPCRMNVRNKDNDKI